MQQYTLVGPRGRVTKSKSRTLWDSRQVLWYMVVRDVKSRYAETKLGPLWTVAQPLIMLAVFTFAFSRFQRSDIGVPYTVWAIAGITLWIFVSDAVSRGAQSLATNKPLVTRTTVPRMLMPLASVISSAIELAVGLALFVIFALAYGVQPTGRAPAALGVIAVACILSLGLGYVMAPLLVRSKDLNRAFPFLIRMWFFSSPIVYSIEPHETWARVFIDINPLVGLLEAFRWALLDTEPPSAWAMTYSVVFALVAVVLGTLYFARTEHDLVDDL